MRQRSDGLLAAALTLISTGIVVFGTAFTLSRRDEWYEMLGHLSPTLIGLLTLAIVLAAGLLLAYAFDRGEEAYLLLRQRPEDGSEGGERG